MPNRDHDILYQLCCCHSSVSGSLNTSIAFFFSGFRINHLFGVHLFLSRQHLVFFGLNSVCYGGSFPLKKLRKHANHIPSFLKYLLSLRALWFKTHRSSVLKDVQQSPVKSHSAWRVQLADGIFRFSSFCFDHVLLL